MIFLGKVLKTRGNKGEVVIRLSPGVESSRIKEGDEITLILKKSSIKQQVKYVREISGKTVLKLSRINSINEAYKIIDSSLFMEGDPSAQQQEDFLTHFTVTDIHGQLWGRVRRIRHSDLNPIIEVESGEEVIDVPFNEGIVKDIDWEDRSIILDPPDGLRDLNR